MSPPFLCLRDPPLRHFTCFPRWRSRWNALPRPRRRKRIVAFFQKNPTGSAAASFMEKEFGEGGKGVSVGGQDYSLWFSKEGLRIAQGRSAFGPGSTLVTWVNAAVMVSSLLREGRFASQEKIAAAEDNEYRELAGKLWHLRQDFSDSARERYAGDRRTAEGPGQPPADRAGAGRVCGLL